MPVSKDDCLHCFGEGVALSDKDIGKRLRKMREGKNCTLRGVARLMRISNPYLSFLERGQRVWSTELIKRYLKAIQ